MHDLMKCKNCKAYLGGVAVEDSTFGYCSEKCKTERENKGIEQRREENARDLKSKKATLAFVYEAKMLKDKPIDEETGKVVKINKTTGKPRKKRVEKGPRKCGKCGGSGHNARTCNRR